MQDHVEREKQTTSKYEPNTLLDQITTQFIIECQRLEFENRSRVRLKQGPGSEYTSFSRDDGPTRKHAHNPSGVQCTNFKQRSMEPFSGDPTELVVNNWSTLLDSGATSHLVKERKYFWTHNEDSEVYQTRASGTCVARFTYNGVSTRVTLKDCLHAPNAFVNHLSVSRFVTAEVACTFEKGCVLLSKAGKAFGYGTMVNKLFVLEVEFLKPPIDSSKASGFPSSLIVETHMRLSSLHLTLLLDRTPEIDENPGKRMRMLPGPCLDKLQST